MKYLGKRINDTIEISMERVAAHLKDPSRYPLPSNAQSLERAMYNLLDLLPKRKKKRFIEKHEERLSAGAAKRKQWYDDLVDIDFRSSKSVLDQVKTKPVPESKKISEQDYKRYQLHVAGSAVKKTTRAKTAKSTAAPQLAAGSKLNFNVLDITCNKTSELGKDEISLGAFFIDPLGNELTVEPFELGDFKKGTRLPLGEEGKLFDAALDDPNIPFPQTFIASLFLLEKDLLRNSKVVRAIAIVLAAIFLAAAAVGTVCTALFFILKNLAIGVIGFIALVVGFGALILLKILSLFADDFSDTVSDILVFDTPPQSGEIFNRSLTFSLLNGEAGLLQVVPGKYTANIRWTVL